MNTQTFKKRIKFAYTQAGTLNKRFRGTVEIMSMLAKGEQYHPYYWKRSKGFCNLYGHSDAANTQIMCDHLGLELLWDNDAPRGGEQGKFMYLSKKDRGKLKDVDFKQILA